jgi:endo-1,4-beta-xylanase
MKRAFALSLAVLCGTVLHAGDPLAEAGARIEKYRKGDIRVRVESAGRAVAGAKVEIQQTGHAFLFGSNIFFLEPGNQSDLQRKYQERFRELLNYATLGFYWGAYEPSRGKTGEAHLRKMAEWCRKNSIQVKGHPVVWHEVFPKWIESGEPMAPLLEARIAGTIGKFRGLIDRWDVVNESLVAPDYRNAYGEWVKGLGPTAAVEKCLRWAEASNPQGLFLVNDFKVSPEYEAELADLKARKAPFAAIGIQSHMHTGEWPLEKVWSTCESYARIGLPIHFTEVTVLSGPKESPMRDYQSHRQNWLSTAAEEEKQADYVEKFYTVLFSHPSVEAITWWDFSDAASWMGAPSGFLRKDMSPKPVYERLRKKIKGDWWTKAAATTGPSGEVVLRGFYGSYAVTVTGPGDRKATRSFDLKKGESPTMVMEIPGSAAD